MNDTRLPRWFFWVMLALAMAAIACGDCPEVGNNPYHHGEDPAASE